MKAILSQTEAPVVLVLGPSRGAVSGVATHLNLLFGSNLDRDFKLVHFQVGSEGRDESRAGRLLRLAASPFALTARILATRTAVVHINTSYNRGAFWRDLAYLAAAKLCGARVLYQVHGGPLAARFLPSRAGRALMRAALSLPDIVVVLTRPQLESHLELVPDLPVVAVPNGIDLSPYAQRDRGSTSPGTPLRLVYVGRLSRDKGLFEALEGLAQARSQGIEATLEIAGGGPDQAALEMAASRLKLEGIARFAGPVFGEDKLAAYDRADALLLPSYAEAMPYALLECMAAGVPAIATRVGGIPDVMIEGIHGLLIPPRDAAAIAAAIAEFARDRARLEAMREPCRRRIAHSYSIDRLAADFGRIYASLGSARRPGLLGRY